MNSAIGLEVREAQVVRRTNRRRRRFSRPVVVWTARRASPTLAMLVKPVAMKPVRRRTVHRVASNQPVALQRVASRVPMPRARPPNSRKEERAAAAVLLNKRANTHLQAVSSTIPTRKSFDVQRQAVQ